MSTLKNLTISLSDGGGRKNFKIEAGQIEEKIAEFLDKGVPVEVSSGRIKVYPPRRINDFEFDT